MPKDKEREPRSSSSRHHDRDLATLGVEPISEDDYFLKSDNFRLWLRKEKGRYFDELSGEKARHYFAKFVKAWNKGQLSSSVYNVSPSSTRASEETSYKWSFAKKLDGASEAYSFQDAKAIEAARQDVLNATSHTITEAKSFEGSGSGPKRREPIGPMMPPPSASSSSSLLSKKEESEADAQYAHEERLAKLQLSKSTRAPKESTSEFAPGSKERQLEKKAERRVANAEYREAKGGGMDEVREDVLMGSGDGDSFAAKIRARDAARARKDAQRDKARGGAGVIDERRAAMKQKDDDTMDMFKRMAKERFG